jgi:hypothetical protein
MPPYRGIGGNVTFTVSAKVTAPFRFCRAVCRCLVAPRSESPDNRSAGNPSGLELFFTEIDYPSKEELVGQVAIEELLAVAPKDGLEIQMPA